MTSEGQNDHLISELRETMARMEIALGSIEEMIFWTDAAGSLRWCNDTFARWLERPRVLLLNKPVTELLPLQSMDQELPEAAHPVSVSLAQQTGHEGDYESLSGIPLRIKTSYMPGLDSGAGSSGVIGLIHDLTREQELEEFKIRGIAMSAAVNAIALLDEKERIQWVNQAFTTMTGYTLDEVFNHPLRMLESESQNRNFHAELWDTVRAGKPWEGMLENRKKTGEPYHEFQSITPVQGEEGAISAFIVFKQEITEQVNAQKALKKANEELEKRVANRTKALEKQAEALVREVEERRQAEQAVREGEAFLQSLLKGLGAAYLVQDDQGRFVDCNAIAEERFGVPKTNAVGKPCSQLYKGLDKGTRETICNVGENEPSYDEVTIQTASGQPEFAARHLLNTSLDNQPHKAVVLFDITEKKALERQLSVTQKLESIGQLAAGIAHEINTPIQYIGDSLRFMREALDDMNIVLETADDLARACREQPAFEALLASLDEAAEEADMEFLQKELPKAFDRALDGVERVANIVRAMKNFSHPGGGEKKGVDLNEAVETTLAVARNEWKYVAEVATDLDPTLPKVLALPGDLNQVILNIVVNAAHAINEKGQTPSAMGTITIATRKTDGLAELVISDTGDGIPEEIRDRVFDPFFTTKEPGKGTGQGLAIVHDIIVNKHGGTVAVESEPGTGTSFILHLPFFVHKEGLNQ